MKTIQTIAAYYKEIRLPMPKHPNFHIERHENNLGKIKLKQQPIKHELFSISLINLPDAGSGLHINKTRVKYRLFIISPYKEISWDITGQEIKGIYIIFDREFVRSNPLWVNFLLKFPFFKIEHLVTDDISDEFLYEMHQHFEQIYQEYHRNNNDLEIIKAYVQIILLLIKRYFSHSQGTVAGHDVKYKLLAEFETLLAESLGKTELVSSIRKPSYYAGSLNVHINHLNSILKQLTGKTTSELIYEQLAHHARLLIQQTDVSIKELASHFHFSDPTHFISFFKKQTGLTPRQFKVSLSA